MNNLINTTLITTGFWIGLLILVMGFLQPALAVELCFESPERAHHHLVAKEETQAQSLQSASQSTININTATEAELTALNGVASKKAQAIIAYRSTFGDFKSIDELTNVKGIGVKTVAKNRSKIRIR